MYLRLRKIAAEAKVARTSDELLRVWAVQGGLREVV
jgi:hypothetical protein